MAVHRTESERIDPRGWIRTHLDFLQELPSPAGVWVTHLQPWSAQRSRVLAEQGVTKHVGRAESSDASSYWVYRTKPEAWEYIQERLAERTNELPCGHTGFKNIDGEIYECRYERCGEQYRRAVVKEALSE